MHSEKINKPKDPSEIPLADIFLNIFNEQKIKIMSEDNGFKDISGRKDALWSEVGKIWNHYHVSGIGAITNDTGESVIQIFVHENYVI